jgi:hypothetical protein
MGKTYSNVARTIVDSLSIMDTLSEDGVTAVAVATASAANTFTCTGLNVLLNALAGMDIVVFTGSAGAPAIRNIVSNTATTAGSTVITVSANWAVNPAVGACAQIAPSATWINLGLMGEVPMKMELKNSSTIPVSDGSLIQKSYELVLTSDMLQILDVSVVEALKNKTVWIKANPSNAATQQALILRNIKINIEAAIDLSVKGKGSISINGSRYIQSITDAVILA